MTLLHELHIKLILKQSCHHLATQEHISKWINRTCLSDQQFTQCHYDPSFKFYHFSNLFPIEIGGIYQKGKAYTFTLRSPIEDIITRISTCFQAPAKSSYFQYIASEHRGKQLKHVTQLMTITPAIVTINRKPWLHHDNIDLLIHQLHANAEKKFKQLITSEKLTPSQPFFEKKPINQPFIHHIHIKNIKPIAIHYKSRKLLGNKFIIYVNKDAYSQQLAHIVMGSGLAEKGSSLGAGFCLANFLS